MKKNITPKNEEKKLLLEMKKNTLNFFNPSFFFEVPICFSN